MAKFFHIALKRIDRFNKIERSNRRRCKMQKLIFITKIDIYRGIKMIRHSGHLTPILNKMMGINNVGERL